MCVYYTLTIFVLFILSYNEIFFKTYYFPFNKTDITSFSQTVHRNSDQQDKLKIQVRTFSPVRLRFVIKKN